MEYFPGMTVPKHKTAIFIHCLATSRGWGEGKSANDMVKEVTVWHVRDNGWSGIAYAAVIDYRGGVGLGRDLNKDGNVLDDTAAAARGYNTSGIHIALAGGRGSHETDDFFAHYTKSQDRVLREMIQEIANKAARPLYVRGHNEVAAKACPGFSVPNWYGATMVHPKKPAVPSQSFFARIFAAIFGGRA